MGSRKATVFALIPSLAAAVLFAAGRGARAASAGAAQRPPGATKGDSSPEDGDPWVSRDRSLMLVESYLDRMKLKHERDTSKKLPCIKLPVTLKNATHRLHIVADAERRLLYIFLNRYLVVPRDHPNLDTVLRTLMDHNWGLNLGKLEWDKSDGEVRMSHTFTTENGVGFEAFAAVVTTVTRTGDKLWPELSKLAARK